jgi:hypothetical protein
MNRGWRRADTEKRRSGKMRETTNIEITKGKIAMAAMAFFLALIAAAALQSPALAEIASAPSTSKDSIAAGPPKHQIKPRPGQAVGTKEETEASSGELTARFTQQNTYRPGAMEVRQIVGTPYHTGNVLLMWEGSKIYRSTSYAGTQDISITHKIYKWNPNTGQWDPFIFPTSQARVYAGQHAQMPNRFVTHWDTTNNYFFVDIEVKWKTTSGQLIAKKTLRTAHGSDYMCAPLLSWHTCRSGGTQGSLVWLYMSV